jgi:hypothetical protein
MPEDNFGSLTAAETLHVLGCLLKMMLCRPQQGFARASE